MKTIDTLHELLRHELKDLYSAESQIIEALPAMIEKAANKQLKKALQDHLAVTEKQKQRLEKIQQMLGEEKSDGEERKGFFANLFKSKEGEEHCKAMEGLVKEGKKLLGEDMSPQVMDAGIIAAAQKVEHYEISSYGTARAYALQLKLNSLAAMLEETLNEEYDADDALTRLALSDVNLQAETPKHGRSSAPNGRERNNGKANGDKKAPSKKPVAKKAGTKKGAGTSKNAKAAPKKSSSKATA